MSSSAESIARPVATAVRVTEESLTIFLADGRSVSVPTTWYPRLEHATPDERQGWTLVGNGAGIHWEAIDEDISVEALIAGKRSNESEGSLRRWFGSRGA